MCMKYTRATLISATVFHKHKYITNLDIMPEYQVIAAARNLADKLKGRMPPHISETTLNQLERIGTILKQGMTQMVQNNPPRKPPNPPPPPTRNRPASFPVQVAPTPAPLATPLPSSTVPPPRVMSPPKVKPPTMAPLPPPNSGSLSNTDTFTLTGVPTQ